MSKFLDKTGLAALWTKCKDTFVKKSELKTINGESIIGTGDITISGGDVDFYKDGYLYAYGMYDKRETGCAFGFNDNDEPCILNTGRRSISIATDSLDGNYLDYQFPEYSGEVAVIDQNGCLGVPELGASNYFWLGDNDELIFDPAAGTYSISGGTLGLFNTNIMLHSSSTGIMMGQSSNGFFNAEEYPGIATDDGSIFVSTGGQMSTDQGNWIYFPDKEGTLAMLDDIKYQHDIYIMPGNSNTAGVYIYLTLNTTSSTKITSVASLTATLYNRGNNVQQQAVSATGRCGSSSSSFSGFIIGVWASSTSTLNVAYLTTSGTLSTTSYSASMFTSMRDTVN